MLVREGGVETSRFQFFLKPDVIFGSAYSLRSSFPLSGENAGSVAVSMLPTQQVLNRCAGVFHHGKRGLQVDVMDLLESGQEAPINPLGPGAHPAAG